MNQRLEVHEQQLRNLQRDLHRILDVESVDYGHGEDALRDSENQQQQE